MKGIYNKYIKIEHNEKISDRVFKTRIALSVIAIISCLTIMISTAMAFFNSNITQNFTMTAAKWDIRIENSQGDEIGGTYVCPATEDEIHEFVIFSSGTATNGYCIIKITDEDENTESYSTPVFKDKKTVKIQAVAGCKIKFIPKWGSPDDYDIDEADIVRGTIRHSFTPPPPEESPSDNGESSLSEQKGQEDTQKSDDTSSKGDADTSLEDTKAVSENKETSNKKQNKEVSGGDSSEKGTSSSLKNSAEADNKISESSSIDEVSSSSSKITGESKTASAETKRDE